MYSEIQVDSFENQSHLQETEQPFKCDGVLKCVLGLIVDQRLTEVFCKA